MGFKSITSEKNVKWIFDVEILARYKMILQDKGLGSLKKYALEQPLEKWIDIQGSKVKIRDFFLAALELIKIYRMYNLNIVRK